MGRIAVIALAVIGAPILIAQQPGPAVVEVASIKRTVNGIISGQGAARVGWNPGGVYRMDDGSLSVLRARNFDEAAGRQSERSRGPNGG
jgi:hypothetical protein